MKRETRPIYLVRHGVTAWNREMRMQGHTDVPLDPEGRAQAEAIGARLSLLPAPPAAVYSSDLSRAVRTAEAIAAPLNLTVQTTALLRETMLGVWEGLTREEIEARGDGDLLQGYLRDSHHNRPPDSEKLEEVWARMNEAMQRIRTAHPDDSVAIVGHGGSLRVLLCAALGTDIDSMRRLWLDNASLSILEESPGPAPAYQRVLLVNDTSHIKQDHS